MSKEILIVPDVHGRSFWQPALNYAGDVVFLGDYLDPYPAEKIDDTQAYEEFKKIIEFKQKNHERVTLLIGNHEMHYYNRRYNAGRFSSEYFETLNKIFTGEETKGLFQLCKQVDNFLFIHAGVTKNWYDRHFSQFENLGETLEERLNNVFFELMHIYHEASTKFRGGLDDTGSPLWADIREFGEETERFDPNIYQILGHTQRLEEDPIIEDTYCMLDNRRLYILRNGKIEKYKA